MAKANNEQQDSPMYHSEEPPPFSPDRPVFRVVQSATEAEEHLRVIRQAMERSTRHSTFSGFSGIVVGVLAMIGYLLTHSAVLNSDSLANRFLFIGVWSAVLFLSILADTLLTKRRGAQLGKTPLSPLGKHLARAAAPGFIAALAVSLFSVVHPEMIGPYLYGIWMLCYGVSLLAVGMFSVKEVSWLGWAFLAAGVLTLFLPIDWYIGPRGMQAVTFGGFHILYGAWMGSKYGW
jgi:hypothetical protein